MRTLITEQETKSLYRTDSMLKHYIEYDGDKNDYLYK
jgi:hypothetical protein